MFKKQLQKLSEKEKRKMEDHLVQMRTSLRKTRQILMNEKFWDHFDETRFQELTDEINEAIEVVE